jgi:exopolyphosphatase/guanosine-5'-triphosphate,3'-diphosphate pyrophosphatase
LLTQINGFSSADEELSQRNLRKLHWASQLHEIGSHISHSDYHKHGAYILENADAMGFSLAEMHRLSLLVLGHRGKLRKLEADLQDESLRSQLVALRIAVILCHARRDPSYSGLVLTRSKKTNSSPERLQLHAPAQWSQEYPQSAYRLREEASAWQKTLWPLDFMED